MRAAIIALTLSLVASAAAAQDLRDFCAERPGKATPPCILDKGHVQVEVGLYDVTLQRGGGVHEDDYALGAFEVRYGVSRRTEVEAGWAPLIIDRAHGAGRATGVGDAVLGVRTALTDPDADGLAVSAQAFVTAPTATRGLGAGGWTGGLRLPVAAPLGDNFDLGLTPEADLVRDSDGRGAHFALAGAAGVSRAFGRLTFGAELWGQMDDDPADRIWQASADLFAAWMGGENLQLDAGVNLGLAHDTPDVEVYAGVARRF
jgi:hypothetical protein